MNEHKYDYKWGEGAVVELRLTASPEIAMLVRDELVKLMARYKSYAIVPSVNHNTKSPCGCGDK